MTSKIQNSKFKVIILTQYYPPEHGAPQNRLHDLARRWAAVGHEITVLTAMPNYPAGKIFGDYRGKFFHEENIDGVKVFRTWIFASKSGGILCRLLTYFSFVLTSLVVGPFKLSGADFLICESPPLFLGFSAVLLNFFTGGKLVMNISDLWPESAVQLGILKRGVILNFLELFEKFLYQRSSLVTCQTEGIVSGVKKRNPSSKTFLFPNGVDLEMFKPCGKNANLAKEFDFPENHLIVGYGGNHGHAQALSQVLEAAKILRHEKIFFAFFGDGPEKAVLKKKASDMNLKNLKFYPSQPRDKMWQIQSLWDIALVPLKDVPIFEGARPSKMFELMAGEIPFIFCGRGEGAKVAGESSCAKIAPPENPEKLASTIAELANLAPEKRSEMGKKGRAFVSAFFDRTLLSEKLLNKLKKL